MEPNEFLNKVLEDFHNTKKEILSNTTSDRNQIDQYITIFHDRIKDESSTKQYYVEAITSLLSTKAKSSADSIKALDAMSKIISSIKNHDAFEASAGNDEDISDLLQEESTASVQT